MKMFPREDFCLLFNLTGKGLVHVGLLLVEESGIEDSKTRAQSSDAWAVSRRCCLSFCHRDVWSMVLLRHPCKLLLDSCSWRGETGSMNCLLLRFLQMQWT